MSITSTTTGRADRETGRTHSAAAAHRCCAPGAAAASAARGSCPGDPQTRQVARRTI
jgi:hypothetical protein